MRLLVLTFYYPPDLSAGSFRVDALVRALSDTSPPGAEIEVITTVPNRYATFAQQAASSERNGGVEVTRFELPEHTSDIKGQSLAFAQFARQARRHVASKSYDMVFATSSRLMTATLGAAVARSKRVPLYLDIRDIFVDTIGDLLPRYSFLVLKPVLSAIESWTMRSATRINLVSRGFAGYFERRYPDAVYSWFTNGVDQEFVGLATESRSDRSGEGPIELLYAGNIGSGQALHQIVPGLARALEHRARFTIIGDGGQRPELEQAIAGLTNVDVQPPMNREHLLERYRAADVLFLHLGRVEAFEKVLPSKLFEYAATGKPVLAGVAGFAAEFTSKEIENSAVFAPGDVEGALSALDTLETTSKPRNDFVDRYDRRKISLAMAEEIWTTLGAS